MDFTKFIPVVCIFVCLASKPSPAQDERKFRYKMYRNPAKEKILVLPIQGEHLEPPARAILTQILNKEAHKLKEYKVIAFPKGSAESDPGWEKEANQLDPGVVGRRQGADAVLKSKLHYSNDQYSLYAEIISVQDGSIKASYHEECKCPIGEVIFWVLPEAIRQLNHSLGISHSNCQRNMVYITAGHFRSGSKHENDMNPVAERDLKGFCLDLYEYPNLPGEQPITAKTWEEASSLCSGNGKRLCSEFEWEYGCRGRDSFLYPYGNEYSQGKCNTESQTIQLAGEKRFCMSPFGVFDLAGNVYEWTSSSWSSSYKERVVRGGNWNSGQANSRCSLRFAQPPDLGSKAIGFRCCSDLEN